MNYYFYQDWTEGHTAIIHLGNCSWCKNGRGVMPEEIKSDAPNAGRWSRQFDTYQQVEMAAQETGAAVRICGHCRKPQPHLLILN